MAPRAVIFGCRGTSLSDWERGFFAEVEPLGFILFTRNCREPEQLRALIGALCETVGGDDVPILIDQEGGRVARLKPPHWRAAPAPRLFGDLAVINRERAEQALRLNTRLLAAELRHLGITVNCTPVLDLRLPEAHGVIGDRAFGDEPALVAALGRVVCETLLANGVMPVIKHLPGHGRATVDSHESLPRVETPREVLAASDFEAFRRLSDAPWGMTAHVVYSAVDDRRPATTSPRVIGEVIRGDLGFDGVLASDDLSMAALEGDLGRRAGDCLAAGCDVALHCNGAAGEMEEVAAAVAPLTPAAQRRLAAARARLGTPDEIDAAALAHELDLLLDRA